MTQAVSRRLLTEEDRVRPQDTPSNICGERSGTDKGFSPSTSGFPLTVSFHQCHVPLVRSTNGRSLGTFKKQCSFGNRVAMDRKVFPPFVFGLQTVNVLNLVFSK
jgi:hypothetical protein